MNKKSFIALTWCLSIIKLSIGDREKSFMVLTWFLSIIKVSISDEEKKFYSIDMMSQRY